MENANGLRQRLFDNFKYWRLGLQRLGFRLLDGGYPIVRAMLADAHLAQDMSVRLCTEGVLASAFFFPIAPKGQAPIRTQMTAAQTREDLDFAPGAFQRAGRAIGVII